jgi:hypothetical protein
MTTRRRFALVAAFLTLVAELPAQDGYHAPSDAITKILDSPNPVRLAERRSQVAADHDVGCE